MNRNLENIKLLLKSFNQQDKQLILEKSTVMENFFIERFKQNYQICWSSEITRFNALVLIKFFDFTEQKLFNLVKDLKNGKS